MKQFIYFSFACAMCIFCATGSGQQIEYCDVDIPVGEVVLDGFPVEIPCEPCDAGIPVCSQCLEVGCDGNCHRIFRRLGFYGGAVYDIPLAGIFQAETFLGSTAGGLGVDPLVLPAATEVELLMNEVGFDDIYDGFFGYNANITLVMDRSTKWYVGYKHVNAQADPLEVGQAIVDPLGVANTEEVTAQFDDYEEWSIQVGFLTSQAIHRKLEFLWGGRGSVAMTEAINGTFTIPNVLTLTDVPLYEDSTILSFGVNLGVRYNLKPNFSLVAVTGAEYRTSLNQDDSLLRTLGLGSLNNGSGLVSLPILVGGTINF